ncbi:hypothetical protein N0M98_07885 [Paenibacillus doosanensis]|nr:hypothetical protein [Paenibacillus doosanensis]
MAALSQTGLNAAMDGNNEEGARTTIPLSAPSVKSSKQRGGDSAIGIICYNTHFPCLDRDIECDKSSVSVHSGSADSNCPGKRNNVGFSAFQLLFGA